MFSTVASGLVVLAQRARDTWPDHEPFKAMCSKVETMDETELRTCMEDYLLPVAQKLQKKDLLYFKNDPTFAALDLTNVDFDAHPQVTDEIFTVLNHSLLLQSTLSLLPQNLVDVAQGMAAKMTSAVTADGQIDQAAMGSILAEAMAAAGVYKQPIAQMDQPTARAKLQAARKNLM
jgi:hypothetical protein